MTAFHPEENSMAKATPIQVSVDTEKLTELLNPLIEEINALRARVKLLEDYAYGPEEAQ